jgi:hypothetical protein
MIGCVVITELNPLPFVMDSVHFLFLMLAS